MEVVWNAYGEIRVGAESLIHRRAARLASTIATETRLREAAPLLVVAEAVAIEAARIARARARIASSLTPAWRH
jgi:hypothetical protein